MAHDEIGLAFHDVLSMHQRRALAAAGDMLLDEWFDEIGAMLHDDAPSAETTLAGALPPSYRLRLTPLLAKQFHTCLTTVLWKLAQPSWIALACLGEELALRAIIDRAHEHLGTAADFGDFEDAAFDDLDHEYLFDPRWDGVDGSAIGQALGIGSLGLEDCFTVYAGGVRGAVYPYCVNDTPSQA
jgi:hypothetical protein